MAYMDGLLTDRELDVLELVSRGFASPEAGKLLGISPWTVKDHMKMVRIKLGARNQAHAVALAFDHGILR